ncbi:MAG TPA: Maf family protein [Patescibacteria group bacterium]|nr:Maf family protein [Patescibacteria group bacterium]
MRHKIILASRSPRRRELLRKIVKSFRVIESNVDESLIRAKTPLLFAKKAAAAKAKAIAEKHKNSIVIGADTIVVLGRKILGKPKDKKDAAAMLKSLSGTTHKVITGLAVIIPGKKMISSYALTRVTMKKISPQAIADYVDSGRPLDKAGAYGIQEIEDPFIEKIDGNYDNVVGLPVAQLEKILLFHE